MSEEFRNVCLFFKSQFEEIGADLPSTWSIEEFTQLLLGVEEVFDPSYLSNVYSDLLELGFQSWYFQEAFDYLNLIHGLDSYLNLLCSLP